MILLPDDFCNQMRSQFSEAEYTEFMNSMNEACPVSIRLNPLKQIQTDCKFQGEPIPWCKDGIYLSERPSFTMDPLFHAGAYYVQEASSMFISYLCNWIKQQGEWDMPINALDLCAAPGGKSTLLYSELPEQSLLITNEIMPKRAQILRENMHKWTMGVTKDINVYVTNNKSEDFKKAGKDLFDFILCDAPCSGEGMFRKDSKAIEDWSLSNVNMCQERQRDIVTAIWPTLKDGGYMIYSTCTYNFKEDEDNVRWIAEELDTDIIDVEVPADWGVSDSPFFHFYPHKAKGEGFFCALLRKHGDNSHARNKAIDKAINKNLKVLNIENKFEPPYIDVDSNTALRYLHGEALNMPTETPRGLITITYQGLPLGQVKNIGNRANNLYPKEWRIRKQI